MQALDSTPIYIVPEGAGSHYFSLAKSFGATQPWKCHVSFRKVHALPAYMLTSTQCIMLHEEHVSAVCRKRNKEANSLVYRSSRVRASSQYTEHSSSTDTYSCTDGDHENSRSERTRERATYNSSVQSSCAYPLPALTFSSQCWKCFVAARHFADCSHSSLRAGRICTLPLSALSPSDTQGKHSHPQAPPLPLQLAPRRETPPPEAAPLPSPQARPRARRGGTTTKTTRDSLGEHSAERTAVDVEETGSEREDSRLLTGALTPNRPMPCPRGLQRISAHTSAACAHKCGRRQMSTLRYPLLAIAVVRQCREQVIKPTSILDQGQ